MRTRDLTGLTINRLTVLERVRLVRRRVHWRCQCICGRETIVPAHNLVNGHTKSCGCYQRERSIAQQLLRPYEALYRNLLRRAKRANLPIDLEFEDFLQFVRINHCHYCDRAVRWSASDLKRNGSSFNLDRKDNSKGYLKENLVVCCSRCNQGKSDQFSYEEWFAMTAVFRGNMSQITGRLATETLRTEVRSKLTPKHSSIPAPTPAEDAIITILLQIAESQARIAEALEHLASK